MRFWYLFLDSNLKNPHSLWVSESDADAYSAAHPSPPLTKQEVNLTTFQVVARTTVTLP